MAVDPANFDLMSFSFPVVTGGTGPPPLPEPATEDASPAQLVRQLLVDLGLATDPPVDQSGITDEMWPAYFSKEPDLPDSVITVYNTVGRTEGRNMVTLTAPDKPGIQVRVRCGVEETGWSKVKQLMTSLGQVYDALVVIDGKDYNLHSISRTGTPAALGQERGGNRLIWTINYVVTMEKLS